MEQISLFSPSLKSTQKPGSRKLNSTLPQIPDFFIHRELPVIVTRKSYQRSIRFHIKSGKTVQVSCSLRTSYKEITSTLDNHWKWIEKQVSEQKALKRKYPLKKFREGEFFLFQGKKLKLKYESLYSRGRFLKNQKGFYLQNDNLIYRWKGSEDLHREILKKKLRAFYEKEGKRQLRESLSLTSSRMKLFPKSVRIGSQKSLWGSCSSQGTVSLNWRLIAAPPAVLNYVVLHELAHLKFLNHSPAFWSLVKRFCPEYKKYENWLRHKAYSMDFLLPHSELHDG